jgi:hypothetical protein
MIDKLKFLIDQSENNPKIKSILLKVAEMPEDKQEDTLKLIALLIQNKLRGSD